jgi:hypothetical protein
MKKLEVWLNENQYKEFVRKAKLKNLSSYACLKQIVLQFLEAH